ncbi:hypothetical protein DSO57_1037816 [Entomophthora muscae]|nr:hypothetical protein DSO57_1037816 [Entomophthora muscae]
MSFRRMYANLFNIARVRLCTSVGLKLRLHATEFLHSGRVYSTKEPGLKEKVLGVSNRQYRNILTASGTFGVGFALFYFLSPLFDDDRLNPEDFIKVKLVSKKQLTPETTLYRFQYSDSSSLAQESNFPVISHVHVKDHTMQIMRPYTTIPVMSETLVDEKDITGLTNRSPTIDLAVKKYPQGPMSNFLSQIAIGGEIEMRGPYQTWSYIPNQYRLLTMIAAGTGIAPFYQLVHSALQEKASSKDKTRFSLIYYSHDPENIIFKDELLELQKRFPERLNIVFSLTGTDDLTIQQEGFAKGRVSYSQLAELLKRDRFNPLDSKVLVCGPDG